MSKLRTKHANYVVRRTHAMFISSIPLGNRKTHDSFYFSWKFCHGHGCHHLPTISSSFQQLWVSIARLLFLPSFWCYSLACSALFVLLCFCALTYCHFPVSLCPCLPAPPRTVPSQLHSYYPYVPCFISTPQPSADHHFRLIHSHSPVNLE